MTEYKTFKYQWTKHGWWLHFPTGFKTYIKDLGEDQESDLKSRIDGLING